MRAVPASLTTILSETYKSVPTLTSLSILTPPAYVALPPLVNVIADSDVVESTTILFVLSKVLTPPTFRLPSMSVLPFVEDTLNVWPLPLVIVKNLPVVSSVISSWNTESLSTSNVELNVTAESTSRVLLNVTPLSTSSVPSVWTLPLSVSISNTLVPPAVLISNFLLSACKRRPSVIVVCN